MKIVKGKTTIATNCSKADTISKQITGLMFKPKPENILFMFNLTDNHHIHSLFVNFEFDAVYLNNNMKIVEIHKKIQPYKLIIHNTHKSKYLLECLPGTITKHDLKIGDKLKVIG